MRECLVCAQGPLQFLTAINAMLWVGQSEGLEDPRVTLALYDFGTDDQEEQALYQTIRHMATAFDIAEVVLIDQSEMTELSRRPASKAVSGLVTHLKKSEFAEVYLAYGRGSFGNQLIKYAYRSARKIIYGDSFGLVGTGRNLRMRFIDLFRNPTLTVKKWAKTVLYGNVPDVEFDLAVLILPMDWTGESLQHLHLSVPPREFVQETIGRFASVLPPLSEALDAPLKPGRQTAVLLMSNLYDAGLVAEGSDFLLYVDIIEELLSDGVQQIVLKSHPRSGPALANRLRQTFSGRCDLVLVTDGAAGKVPIEFWMDVFSQVQIVPVFSTSAINLRYLYGRSLKMVLTEDRVERFFISDKREVIHQSRRMMEDCIQALASWDGRGVLWRRAPNHP